MLRIRGYLKARRTKGSVCERRRNKKVLLFMIIIAKNAARFSTKSLK